MNLGQVFASSAVRKVAYVLVGAIGAAVIRWVNS